MFDRLPKLLRVERRPLDDRDGDGEADDEADSGDDSDMMVYVDCGAANGEKAVLNLRRERAGWMAER